VYKAKSREKVPVFPRESFFFFLGIDFAKEVQIESALVADQKNSVRSLENQR